MLKKKKICIVSRDEKNISEQDVPAIPNPSLSIRKWLVPIVWLSHVHYLGQTYKYIYSHGNLFSSILPHI